MGMNERTYSSIANNLAKDHLQGLLDSKIIQETIVCIWKSWVSY